MKMSSGSRRICLAGSSSVEAMALFRYKLFWNQTLLGLFIAKTCTFTLWLLIETFNTNTPIHLKRGHYNRHSASCCVSRCFIVFYQCFMNKFGDIQFCSVMGKAFI